MENKPILELYQLIKYLAENYGDDIYGNVSAGYGYKLCDRGPKIVNLMNQIAKELGLKELPEPNIDD